MQSKAEGTPEEGGGSLNRLVSGLQLHTMPGAAFSTDSHRLDPSREAVRQPADPGARKQTSRALNGELWDEQP